VLFPLAYLGVTNTVALLRLLPMSDHNKDAEILARRHQIMVLERHLHGDRVRFTPADRAWLAALLHPLPRGVHTYSTPCASTSATTTNTVRTEASRTADRCGRYPNRSPNPRPSRAYPSADTIDSAESFTKIMPPEQHARHFRHLQVSEALGRLDLVLPSAPTVRSTTGKLVTSKLVTSLRPAQILVGDTGIEPVTSPV
jgi:hypothetical protein